MPFADLRRKPNILLIVTDQEREVMHWPTGWAEGQPAGAQPVAGSWPAVYPRPM
jgi:hypothetical protein